MVCQRCEKAINAVLKAFRTAPQSSFDGFVGRYSCTYSHSYLCRSAQNVCVICTRLLEQLAHSTGERRNLLDLSKLRGDRMPHLKTLWKQWSGGGNLLDFELDSCGDTFYVFVTLRRRNIIRGVRLRLDSVDLSITEICSDENIHGSIPLPLRDTLKLCKHWVRACSESHTRCRERERDLQPFVPARLVEIATTNHGASFSWRIVESAGIGFVPYVTLSHCWGKTRCMRLKKGNRHKLSQFTPHHKLPQTYQDAFLISYALEYRFIWIDSLCIVQDDLGDWADQAAKMRWVYQGAQCNIAATWAPNGDGGCFVKGITTEFIHLDIGPGPPVAHSVMNQDCVFDDVENAPLNKRGWVVQERYLARKQLSFTKMGAYWECHELCASEQFPNRPLCDGLNFRHKSHKRTLHSDNPLESARTWSDLVKSYSRCDFTRVDDKVVALAGLADEMRKTTGDVYLVGLWKKDLVRQLCWSTHHNDLGIIGRLKTPSYLAPTWSWMNVAQPVSYDRMYCRTGAVVLFCIEVLEVSCPSNHESLLHSFVSCKLILRGVAFFARAAPVTVTNILRANRDEINLTVPSLSSQFNEATCFRVYIEWDETTPCFESFAQASSAERQSELLYMMVSIRRDDDHYRYMVGLILRRNPNTINDVEYERMGIFEVPAGDFYDFWCNKLQILPGKNLPKEIDLNNSRLEGLVHTVTVV